MAEDIRVVSGDAFALLLSGTVDAGQVFADLRPGALSEAAGTNVVWVSGGQYVRGTVSSANPTTLPTPAPVTGHLTHMLAVLNASGSLNANLTITASIGGVPVTNGVVTIATTDAPLVVKSAAPSAANAVTAGSTSVLLTLASANTLLFNLSVLLGFTRAAPSTS